MWAHIHVVDPQAEPQPPTEKEMLEMQAAPPSHASRDNDDGDDEEVAAAEEAEEEEAEEEASEDGELVIVPKPEPEADAIVSAMSAATVTDAPHIDTAAAAAAAPTTLPLDTAMAEAAVPKGAAVLVAEALGQMGFVDPELVQFVVERNGPDLDACVRDLATLNEVRAVPSPQTGLV